MKNYNKKGQAAMEFLMTYGWAILAAVIVIGALGTYFYFNQSTTTTFVVGAPFYGIGASADATSDILSLEIENNGGETITVNSVSVTGSEAGGCTANNTATSMTTNALIFTLSGCTFTAGSSYKGDVIISYQRTGAGGALNLSSSGSLSLAAA